MAEKTWYYADLIKDLKLDYTSSASFLPLQELVNHLSSSDLSKIEYMDITYKVARKMESLDETRIDPYFLKHFAEPYQPKGWDGFFNSHNTTKDEKNCDLYGNIISWSKLVECLCNCLMGVCARSDCTRRAKVGAHLDTKYKDMENEIFTYMALICGKCNQLDTEFSLKSNSPLIRFDVSYYRTQGTSFKKNGAPKGVKANVLRLSE